MNTATKAILMELLNYCRLFVKPLTHPASTCQVERSFSTLRRVKTWLRSTMSTERFAGLACVDRR